MGGWERWGEREGERERDKELSDHAHTKHTLGYSSILHADKLIVE